MADYPAPAEELNTGLLLFIPYRALENRVFDALAAAGFADLTPAQARVFQRVGPHGTRLTDLAAQARITKQSASVLVRELEDNAYISRIPDPSDARARLIVIGPRGAEAIPVAARCIAEVEAEWQAFLGTRQYRQLRGALTNLRQLTDPYL
ncbi:hypothetical protein MN0502_17210 [Arthrobacter sp. MN05-02]|nr:hypothetical protein MN0502_17210 [Arthrobacter sp. MN05-02]